MPAPKGNKFAAKAEVKSKPFGIRLSRKAFDLLSGEREKTKLSFSDIIEKIVLEKFLKNKK